MLRGVLAVLVTAMVVVRSPSASSAATAAAQDPFALATASRFSPNGDGVKDTLRVRINVPRSTRVRLSIGSPGGRVENRRVDLGRLERGVHVWTWDGRNQSGKVVADQRYVIRMYDAAQGRNALPAAFETVQVDTGFAASVTAPTYGAGPKAVARVYPRTTVVTDTLDLDAISHEKKITFLELRIRNARGQVVRRADVDEPIPYAVGPGVYATGRTVSWAAVRGGRPLPKGRYTATVVGGDEAGNTGSSKPLRIWVSDDRLEWQEATTTVTAQESRVSACAYSSANGCGDYLPCGQVVPSELFVGGLSHRPKTCEPADPHREADAWAQHVLEVPEATGVRGLAAVRVSFVGAPTTAGEPDVGALSVPGGAGAATVIGTSGQSGWVDDPAWGEGLEASYPISQRDPAAMWTFSTTDTNQVDVATYTVDVRYLAVAD